jgi:hypothetical protein
VVAGAAGNGCLAAGRFVVRHVVHHDEEKGANADPIAQATTAPPGAEKKPTPKPKPAKPKASKPKPAEPAAKSKPPKPAAAKPKAEAEPPGTTGTDAPPKPAAEPGDMSGGKDPHHALNNPVGEPDETEYPDPYETRPDPLDPVDPDGEPFGEEPHPATGAESTSEPPPEQDPEVGDRAKPPNRENLDQ